MASIVRKDLVNVPPRLQRLLLRLQKYDVTILYKPGKSMIFADHLSHNVNPEASNVPTIPGLNLEVSSLELNASPSKLEHMRIENDRPSSAYAKRIDYTGLAKGHKAMPTPS